MNFVNKNLQKMLATCLVSDVRKQKKKHAHSFNWLFIGTRKSGKHDLKSQHTHFLFYFKLITERDEMATSEHYKCSLIGSPSKYKESQCIVVQKNLTFLSI